MKKIILFGLTVAFLIALSGVVIADDPFWASSVEDYNPGLKKNGSSITGDRANPDNALGETDDYFCSLGYGGEIILSFENPVGGSLTVYEETWGSYPSETAEVYVSEDGTTWESLGTADNIVPSGTPKQRPTEFDLEDNCIKYVKIVDTTNPGPHSGSSDGFDLNSVSAEYECELNVCELTGELTEGDSTIPTSEKGLGVNRWIFDGTDWITGEIPGNRNGPQKSFTIEETRGCNCEQILTWLHENYPEEYGEMKGHYKFGCSISIMEEFIELNQ